jgi:hypothetical protein
MAFFWNGLLNNFKNFLEGKREVARPYVSSPFNLLHVVSEYVNLVQVESQWSPCDAPV